MICHKQRDLRTGAPIWQRPRAARPSPASSRRNIDDRRSGDRRRHHRRHGRRGAGGRGHRRRRRRPARPPTKGSTAASTALVQYEIDTPLIELTRKIGHDQRRARLAALAAGGRCARRRIARRSASRVRDPRHALSRRQHARRRSELRREATARRAVGLETHIAHAQRHCEARYGITRRAALLSYGNLAIDPRKATLALAGRRRAATARAFIAPAKIVDVGPPHAVVARDDRDGHPITARHLVFATGYECRNTCRSKGHKIISTWAIATTAADAAPVAGRMHDLGSRRSLSLCAHDADGRVICGGEDEEFSDDEERDALIERKSATLCAQARKLFPTLDTELEYAWAALVRRKHDRPAHDRARCPACANCWAALGYGGNGTTYSPHRRRDHPRGADGRCAIRDADLYRVRALAGAASACRTIATCR